MNDAHFDELLRRSLDASAAPPIPGLAERAIALSAAQAFIGRTSNSRNVRAVRRRFLQTALTSLAIMAIAIIVIAA